MDKEKILFKISQIFKNRFDIDISKKDLHKSVFGAEWNLLSSDLVYVLFDIEKEFGIKITEADVDSESLYTVDAMVAMIIGKC